jgi:hypothetical protein
LDDPDDDDDDNDEDDPDDEDEDDDDDEDDDAAATLMTSAMVPVGSLDSLVTTNSYLAVDPAAPSRTVWLSPAGLMLAPEPMVNVRETLAPAAEDGKDRVLRPTTDASVSVTD